MPKRNVKAASAKRHPDVQPSHPGAILREIVLPAIGCSKREIAQTLGIGEKKLADLVKERAPVTPELAVRLEAAFGRSAAAWLRLQEAYDLWHTRRHVDVSSIPRMKPAA